mmetsp:Transcript_5178/g.4745  ORF Transcript_5178/g.4745 Transcript_5178/m.4745 type:complete len:84 (+) Transcript_5178:636-887(+)
MKFSLLNLKDREEMLKELDQQLQGSRVSNLQQSMMSGDVNPDVVNRLFSNHKKLQDNKERLKYQYLQQEMNNIYDKPLLSERT